MTQVVGFGRHSDGLGRRIPHIGKKSGQITHIRTAKADYFIFRIENYNSEARNRTA